MSALPRKLPNCYVATKCRDAPEAASCSAAKTASYSITLVARTSIIGEISIESRLQARLLEL
jgi:hypothetical protein